MGNFEMNYRQRPRHRDHSMHIEMAYQLHDVKMTRHGLLYEGLTSANKVERLYNKNLKALIKNLT